MVTPADLIRELTLTNTYLANQNATLKLDLHNLRVTNEMLKNKAATDQAIINAATTIKNLELYNQALEDENQHLREQLECCVEKKRIDDELEVLRMEVERVDEELVKRVKEMEILEEVGEKMKVLKRVGVLGDGQEDEQEHDKEDGQESDKEGDQEDGQPELENVSMKNHDGDSD
ncbi:hypothetical protein E4T48_05530 [Aureobasidium sp. EXF-10727]|nr:hypothetical protein E4T48_05530 [Aureobasidium sp. EXF-10727]